MHFVDSPRFGPAILTARRLDFERAYRGLTLNEAKNDRRVKDNSLNTAVIAHVYKEILKVPGDNDRPTEAANQTCGIVLNTGHY
jgi:hypothetical protein